MTTRPSEGEYTLDQADGPVRLTRSRRRNDAEMDITPMIDITFLLLIFFLVATRISDEGVVDLPPARHGTSVSTKNSVVLTVVRGGGEDATIHKGDGASPTNALAARDLAGQQVEMEDYISRGLRAEGKQEVLIKAEANVRHRDVARVARAAGDAEVRVLYVAVNEEG